MVGYLLDPGRVARWPWAAVAVPDQYVEAVRRAGGRPVVLPPEPEGSGGEAPERTVEPFDGLLLIGGGDIDPARYGAERHPTLYGVDPARDALEVDLILAADRSGTPALAICRGAQVMNVAFGGTLLQHLPDVPTAGPHGRPGGGSGAENEVKLLESSRVAAAAGQTSLVGTCRHHQAIDEIGEGLIPVAWSGDGLIEGVEREAGWVVGVQWHPEESAAADPAQQGLFDELVRWARGTHRGG